MEKRVKTTTKERQKLVDSFCRRWQKHGNLTVAKALYATYPTAFSSLDNARTAVRQCRGNIGKESQRNARVPRKKATGTELPPSLDKPWTPFVFKERTSLIINDVHVPYHDPEAVEATLHHAETQRTPSGKRKPLDLIYINGDLVDFYPISRFTTDPTQRDLLYEVTACRGLLAHLRARFPNTRIAWKMGNHDERWEHYVWTQAPVLASLTKETEVLSLHSLMKLDEVGVELIGGRDRARVGQLHLLHGHEMQMGANSPVSAARTALLKCGECTMVGHYHHTSEQSFHTIGGRLIHCWSTGCLCGLHPEYARVNRWNQGAALVHLHPRSGFQVENFRVHRGEIYA